jgi:hypothetical protein
VLRQPGDLSARLPEADVVGAIGVVAPQGWKPALAHLKTKSASASTAASSAHKNTHISASTPNGGEPGNALRKTGRAKVIAARDPINVVSAGRTFVNVKTPTTLAQQPSTIMAPYAQRANRAKAPLRLIVAVSSMSSGPA